MPSGCLFSHFVGVGLGNDLPLGTIPVCRQTKRAQPDGAELNADSVLVASFATAEVEVEDRWTASVAEVRRFREQEGLPMREQP